MENHTSLPEFHIVVFSTTTAFHSYLFALFILLYVTALLANSIIIAVIYIDKHLHTPMYLFLGNLSLVDLCYITVTVPNLLHMLRSGNFHVSFIKCFIQMYFYDGFATSEVILIFIMAYDRYVAICKPLHYHQFFSRNNCTWFTVSVWLSGCLNSILITISAAKVSMYSSYDIHRFFCDTKALMKIACSDTDMLFIIIYIEVLILGVCPLLCNVMSYIKIIRAVLEIKARGGKRKVFSTCSSHITVLTMFYGTVSCVYLMPLSHQYNVLEMIFTVLYTVVSPMLNPLIYSLHNNDVKKALNRLIAIKRVI